MPSVRFKLDESLPRDAQQLFARASHDARTVHEESLAGAPDGDLLAACQREERVLVTLDVDFGDIRAYPPASLPGVIVLRPAQQSIVSVLHLLSRVVTLLSTESVQHRLWIVEPTRVRIRE